MADVELLRAENKRLANALQSLLRYVERCREAGVLVCDDIGPEEFARYELEQALSLPPEQPAAARGDVRGLVDALVDAAYQDGMRELDAMSDETLSARSALEQALAAQHQEPKP